MATYTQDGEGNRAGTLDHPTIGQRDCACSPARQVVIVGHHQDRLSLINKIFK